MTPAVANIIPVHAAAVGITSASSHPSKSTPRHRVMPNGVDVHEMTPNIRDISAGRMSWSRFRHKRNKHQDDHPPHPPIDRDVPMWMMMATYVSYAVLLFLGHLRDTFGKVFRSKQYLHLSHQDGYAPLVGSFESMFIRRIYRKARECFQRPVTGVPGRHITVLERTTQDYNKTFQLTGKSVSALNLASYNYLGFAQSHGVCADHVESKMNELGVIPVGGPRLVSGVHQRHVDLEALVATFVGMEDAIVFGMGYATNSTVLPALIQQGDLIISDELNHASLVAGARLSNATIRVFPHNDIVGLESVLRDAMAQGQPRTRRPWKRIFVIVEGLYSMEGTVVDLPGILLLKEKYKFYLYVDEAHSIGAMGPRGRGVCDHFGIDPKRVDILMGTFTKSFGAAGGYIAGSKALIRHLRRYGHTTCYAESVAIPVIEQVASSMRIISGEDTIHAHDGQERLERLRENARFFSESLRSMGFIVSGDLASPVVPMLLLSPPMVLSFSRQCLARGIAVVVVGYPATPLTLARVRFCLSASHTREDLERVLQNVSEIGDAMMLKMKA